MSSAQHASRRPPGVVGWEAVGVKQYHGRTFWREDILADATHLIHSEYVLVRIGLAPVIDNGDILVPQHVLFDVDQAGHAGQSPVLPLSRRVIRSVPAGVTVRQRCWAPRPIAIVGRLSTLLTLLTLPYLTLP